MKKNEQPTTEQKLRVYRKFVQNQFASKRICTACGNTWHEETLHCPDCDDKGIRATERNILKIFGADAVLTKEKT